MLKHTTDLQSLWSMPTVSLVHAANHMFPILFRHITMMEAISVQNGASIAKFHCCVPSWERLLIEKCGYLKSGSFYMKTATFWTWQSPMVTSPHLEAHLHISFLSYLWEYINISSKYHAGDGEGSFIVTTPWRQRKALRISQDHPKHVKTCEP